MHSTGADTLTAVLAGAAVYVQLMPNLSEVRRAAGNSATARDVRSGLAMGSAALIGVGLIISITERDWRPLWLTVAAAVLLSGIYEATLRQQGEAPSPAPAAASSSGAGRWGS